MGCGRGAGEGCARFTDRTSVFCPETIAEITPWIASYHQIADRDGSEYLHKKTDCWLEPMKRRAVPGLKTARHAEFRHELFADDLERIEFYDARD
jgi:hypothetical protein